MTRKANWRYSKSAIKTRLGYQWIRTLINRFDHRRLESVRVELRYPKGHESSTRAEYQAGYAGFLLQPLYSRLQDPPPRSRKHGFQIITTVYPWAMPSEIIIDLPPLYRQPGGHWRPAWLATGYAVGFEDDVLDAYAAICAAPDSDTLAAAWATEHSKPHAWIVKHIVVPGRNPTMLTTEYVQVRGRVSLRSVDDGIVFGVAHSAFDWLRKTKQIPGRISNHARDHFAVTLLADFRKWASKERRRKASAKRAGAPPQAVTKIVPGFPGRGGDR